MMKLISYTSRIIPKYLGLMFSKLLNSKCFILCMLLGILLIVQVMTQLYTNHCNDKRSIDRRISYALMDHTINTTKSNRPNIIFILADDLGWNDVGYHNPQIKTPTIDHLAKQGVRLESYYAQSKCTPSRASFLTGRYQSRNGLDRVLVATEAGCLPTSLTLLPEVLRKYGYSTHLIGKWHLGMSRRECLPNNRGFDSFLGFRNGAEDYYAHNHEFFKGLTIPDLSVNGYDFWENDRVARDYKGQYATNIFVDKAVELIDRQANSEGPMFMFVSFSAVHKPLQVPDSYTIQYEGVIEDENRKIYAGMASCMDEGIQNITRALQRNNLWKNTVLIFSSDNGGNIKAGADNFPLKGNKGQFLEGGIRVVGFVHSPYLSKKVIGTEYNGLMGISDWFPTMVDGIAGGSVLGLGLDGVNMWDAIRLGLPSPRTEYVFAVGGNCTWKHGDPKDSRGMYGTIRVGDWKLRIGSISQNSLYRHEEKHAAMSHNGELFNLRLDPYEANNQYTVEEEIRTNLMARLRYHCHHRETYVPLVEREASNPKLNGDIYTTWLQDWDRPEWEPTKTDLDHFEKYYFRV